MRAGNSYFAAVGAGLKGYGGDNDFLGRLEAEAEDTSKHRMLRGTLGEFIAEMVWDVRKAQREHQGVSDTAEAQELLLSRISLSMVKSQTLDQDVGLVLSGMLDMAINVISYGHREKALQVYHYPGVA